MLNGFAPSGGRLDRMSVTPDLTRPDDRAYQLNFSAA